MDSKGNAIVVGVKNGIWAIKYSNDSGWENAPQQIFFTSSLNARGLDLVMDPNGNAIILWYDDGTFVMRYNVDSGWKQPLKIASNLSIRSLPVISMDEYGNAMVIYERLRYPSPGIYEWSFMSKRFIKGEGWEETASVVEAEFIEATNYLHRKSILAFKMHGEGNATFITREVHFEDYSYSNYTFSTHARRYRAGMGWDGSVSSTPFDYVRWEDVGVERSPESIIDRFGNSVTVYLWHTQYAIVVQQVPYIYLLDLYTTTKTIRFE